MRVYNRPEVHTPYVRVLSQAGDWAALVRYWLVHIHDPALEAAIRIVRRNIRRGNRWRLLAEFLDEVALDPVDLERRPSPDLLAAWSGPEQATIQLLAVYPTSEFCENMDEVPPEHRSRCLQAGIRAAERASELAQHLEDSAAEAFFHSLAADGLHLADLLEEARSRYLLAVDIFRRLAQSRPEVYRHDLARVLDNLGTLCQDMHEWAAAERTFAQALSLYDGLSQERPDAYLVIVARIYAKLGQTQHKQNSLEASRASFEQALTRYAAEINKHRGGPLVEEYAEGLIELGNIRSDLGDLKEARKILEDALSLCQRLVTHRPDVFASAIAHILNNLGNVAKQAGDREDAQRFYEQALEALKDLENGLWTEQATVLNNLGAILSDPERAEALLLRARALVQQHPDQRTEETRRLWAGILVNLASAQEKLGRLPEALQTLRESERLWRAIVSARPGAYEPQLADALYNLGALQRTMNDLEDACVSYQEALRINRVLARDRPTLYLSKVATVLNNLSRAQHELHDLDGALANLQESLAIESQLPEQVAGDREARRARALNNIGRIFWERYDLHAARTTFEEAIAIQRSVARRSPLAKERALAGMLGNLGAVHMQLNDTEKARQIYLEALSVNEKCPQRKAHSPEDVIIRTNLGTLERTFKNLRVSQQHYLSALAILRPLAQEQPRIYNSALAMVLNNLGNVEKDLDDLEGAEASYQEALTLRRELSKERPQVNLPAVALTLSNVGMVRLLRADFPGALAALEEAEKIQRSLFGQEPDVYRFDLAVTLVNLASLASMTDRLRPAHDQARKALDLLSQGTNHQPNVRLDERQTCWQILGEVYLSRSDPDGWPDYQQARLALRQSRDCLEGLRGCFLGLRQRHRIQADSVRVYELLVQTCLALATQDPNALAEAVEIAEASRTRNLLDLLAGEALQPADTPPDLVATFRDLHRDFHQLQRTLREAEEGTDLQEQPITASSIPGTTQRGPGGVPSIELPAPVERMPLRPRLETLQRDFERVQQEYQTCLRRIQTEHDPDFNPDQPVRPVTFAEIRQLVPSDGQTAFVQYTLTDQRGLALVVTLDGVQAVALPELNDRQALELANAWRVADHFYKIRNNGRDPNRIERANQALAAALTQLDQESADTANLVRAVTDTHATWENALPALLLPVAERAVRPVVEALADRGIRRLVLVPNRALHVFPLHACTLADGRCLTDAFEVVYTPSLSILHRCARRQRPAPSRLLLAQNPTGDLPFTEVEGAVLRRLYPEHTLLQRQQVTRERLLTDADCPVFHYTGHASFDPGDPLLSALILGDSTQRDRWLTLRDVFTRLHLRNNVLTIISGCESGMVKPDRVDDYVGLPSGFLFAGATCVLCTLWAVYDISSALLMQRFHRLWQAGHGIGAALREAQRWLRDDIVSGPHLRDLILPGLMNGLDAEQRERCRLQGDDLAVRYPDRPPFASPVHWAPFVATGLAYSLPEAKREE